LQAVEKNKKKMEGGTEWGMGKNEKKMREATHTILEHSRGPQASRFELVNPRGSGGDQKKQNKNRGGELPNTLITTYKKVKPGVWSTAFGLWLIVKHENREGAYQSRKCVSEGTKKGNYDQQGVKVRRNSVGGKGSDRGQKIGGLSYNSIKEQPGKKEFG